MRVIKKWTITSPSGQILYANHDTIEPNIVSLSSKKGNHGGVTPEYFNNTLEKMKKDGFIIEMTIKK